MKKRLLFLIPLVMTSASFAQTVTYCPQYTDPTVWTNVYAVDANGNVTHGTLEVLDKAVSAGADVKVQGNDISSLTFGGVTLKCLSTQLGDGYGENSGLVSCITLPVPSTNTKTLSGDNMGFNPMGYRSTYLINSEGEITWQSATWDISTHTATPPSGPSKPLRTALNWLVKGVKIYLPNHGVCKG